MRERRDRVDEQLKSDEDPKEREHRDGEIHRPPIDERWRPPSPRGEPREAGPLHVAQRIRRRKRVDRARGRRERAMP
jgi:hypothetical protein